MYGECWFNLPDGQTARELEVTVPVKGQVKLPASVALEIDEWRDLLREHMQKQRWTCFGTLKEMLATCLAGYQRTTEDALHGAASFRDDVLVMLRAAILVCESIEGDHLNHGQKNERIRGLVGVLERSIHRLRDMRFDFSGAAWQRGFDVCRWDGPERRLRVENAELKARVEALEAACNRSVKNDIVPENECPY